MSIGFRLFADAKAVEDISYMEIGDFIAANISRIIAARGTTAITVARHADLSHTAVRDIISRKSKNPAYLTLLKIAKVLEVDVSEIIGPYALAELTPEEREMLSLMSELSPEQRDFLIKSAKGVAAQKGQDKP